MADIDFDSGDVGLWNGSDVLNLSWQSALTPINVVDVLFGYGFTALDTTLAQIGADFSVTVNVGLAAKFAVSVGTADIDYHIGLNDVPASSSDNPLLNADIGVVTDNWTAGDAGLTQAEQPDGSLTTASLDVVGDISADITNIGLTGSLVPDITLDDVNLADAPFDVVLAALTNTAITVLPDYLGLSLSLPQDLGDDGYIVGNVSSPTLTVIDGSTGDTQADGLVELDGSSSADPFASLGVNLTKILSDLILFPLEDSFDLGPAQISYKIFHADLSVDATLNQQVSFIPGEVDVHVDSSLGQSFDGKLGQDFAFTLGEGYGSFDVTETYTMHGVLTDKLFLELGLVLNYEGLEGSVHVDDVGDEDIGPLIGPGTIPIFDTSIEVGEASYDVTLAPVVRSYTVYWENFYTGTDDAQTLTLTPHQIILNAKGGDDIITGNALDNLISGDTGDDFVFGGDGDDVLNTGSGTDVLDGQNGNDTLHGGSGNDQMFGGDDDDTLIAGTGQGLLLGENGNDTVRIVLGVGTQDARGDEETGNLAGTNDLVVIDASNLKTAFNHVFSGPAVLDAVYPGATILGFERFEVIGTKKADTITGGPGDDIVHGAGGNDVLHSSLGNDIMEGGDGKDIFYHTLGQGADQIFGGTATGIDTSDGDTIYVDAGSEVGVLVILDGAMDDGSTVSGVEKLVMTGTAGDDMIGGGAGADNISGGDGNDFLTGGSGGADHLSGGTGDDTIAFSGPGATINGGAGFDTALIQFFDAKGPLGYVHPDAGGDGILTDGVDPPTKLIAIEAINFTGGKYNDNITGGSHNDVMNGGNGDDSLNGFAGNDFMDGGLDSDTLHGGDGDDNLSANEYILPGSPTVSVDKLYGDAGNDFLAGAQTVAVADGGAGDDIIVIRSQSSPAGTFVPQLLGGSGADDISGSVFAETIVGGLDSDASDGNDIVHAGGGNDTVSGGFGDDVLNGGYGDDGMSGGLGNDVFVAGLSPAAVLLGGTLVYGFGAVQTIGQDGNDTYDGGDGSDTYDASFSTAQVTINLKNTASGSMIGTDKLISIENAIGGGGADTLTGTDANNGLTGNDGNDMLIGRAGQDTLSGGSGADTLKGGDGDDILIGGDDADTLTGGAGSDSFVFQTAAGSDQDLITDYNAGDRIDLSAIDANSVLDGDQAFTLVTAFDGNRGEVAVFYDKVSHLTHVAMDIDGDGTADATILMSGKHLTGVDFIL